MRAVQRHNFHRQFPVLPIISLCVNAIRVGSKRQRRWNGGTSPACTAPTHTASPAPPRRGWEVHLSSQCWHSFPRLLLRLHYASSSLPLLHIYHFIPSCWASLLLFVECDRARGRHQISLTFSYCACSLEICTIFLWKTVSCFARSDQLGMSCEIGT